jgi:hypothetical protein
VGAYPGFFVAVCEEEGRNTKKQNFFHVPVKYEICPLEGNSDQGLAEPINSYFRLLPC